MQELDCILNIRDCCIQAIHAVGRNGLRFVQVRFECCVTAVFLYVNMNDYSAKSIILTPSLLEWENDTWGTPYMSKKWGRGPTVGQDCGSA